MVHIKMSFWDEKEAKRLFQELPFHVLNEKPRIKHSKNKDLLHEFPFYNELSMLKISQVFKIKLKLIKLK